MEWTVYLARCRDGSLYTGIARDVAARIALHNRGRGARFTRARRPVVLVYAEPAPDRPAALRREWAIKRLSRANKETLVKEQPGRVTERDATGFAGFRPAAFRFLRDLKRHNDRSWFEAHRPVYDSEIRRPLAALVGDVDVALGRVVPEIVGDPRHSVFRIYRDVRFSKDKSPYKTHAACWFYHMDAGRGVGTEAEGGAGFYFHFSPDECLLAAGIWMPPRPALTRIREAIADDVDRFEAILESRAFRRRFGALDEEAMLKRLPRGFQDTHPAARWLRYQSFTVARPLSRQEVLSPRLVSLLALDFATLAPFVRWLNTALGYRTLARRV